MATDTDKNGLLDGSELDAYQLFNSGNPITLRNKRGRTFSDSTSRRWNAIAGAEVEDGFLVLAAKSTPRQGDLYQVYTAGKTGIINGLSIDWVTGQNLTDMGFEDIFKLDFNKDNVIGNQPPVEPEPINEGSANFAINGTPAVGQTLSITQTSNDPEGDGTPTITWLTSNQDDNWSLISSDPQITISSDLEGRQLRANIAYTDAEGFDESINTDALTIPFIDNGDATFLIQGTPAVGQTLSITRNANDPDGDGTTSISWFHSPDGVNWALASSNDTFTIPNSLEGQRITATVQYTDGQGFNESITTESVLIPITITDDYGSTPDQSGSLSIGISKQGEIETLGDRDWFGIDLRAGKSYSFELTGTTLEDPYLVLKNSSGTTLSSDDDGGDGLNSRILFSSENTGTYYLEAGSYADQTDGNYEITATEILPPADDYGSTPDQSGSLSIGASKQGEIETLGDRDWFAINLQAGKSYSFELTGITLGDPILYLRYSDGITLLSDDDGGDGLNSRILFSSENSGTYYLDAGSYADRTKGSYEIKATEILAPPPGFSTEDGHGHISARRSFEKLLGVALTDVPNLGGNLWGLDNIDAPEVWNKGENFDGVTGVGAIVAVIDTGVDLDHPEFQGRITNGYDFVDNDNEADDGNGHGTHVAGTIGGANDGTGITGVAPNALIMPIRVLGNNGYGYTSDIISGVYWSADNGADVINLSLGGGGYSQAMADAIAYASDLGSVVVMAAGNSGGGSPDYPAAHAVNHGLAVGAVNQQKALAGFSNRAGSTVLDYVTAPGVDIYSTVPGGGYGNLSGTSMATPHVSGVAGLLKSHDDSLSAERIENLIVESVQNNDFRNNSHNNSDEIIGDDRSSQMITLESFENLKDPQLNGRIIGSIHGNYKSRKSTIRDLKAEKRNGSIIEDMEIIESTRKKFVTLEFGESGRQDHADFIEDLLANNQFSYFEVDTQMTIV